MCRNVSISLRPVAVRTLLEADGRGAGEGGLRPAEEVLEELKARYSRVAQIAEDCTKKSTKAGYDAGGLAVTVVPVAPLLTTKSNGGGTANGALTQVRMARSGGDLLYTWESLVERLQIRPDDLITNWGCHVRQASQGDMYSEVNAHPHYDDLAAPRMRIHHEDPDGAMRIEERSWSAPGSLFYDTHNGDINDAADYKAFLEDEGFRFLSNSDSCVEPALHRYLYEHIRAGELRGAIRRLAVRGRGHRPFLRDDDRSSAQEKISDLLDSAEVLEAAGATEPTIALALAARIFEYSSPSSKFVFESITPVGKPAPGFLGGSTLAAVRGGTEHGGEEGGEFVFHLPREYDARNYGQIAVVAVSDETSLQEQVALLDEESLRRGEIRLAQGEDVKIGSLPGGVEASARMTEGVAPVYDLLPGEILEVTADGIASVFDIYDGHRIELVELEPGVTAAESGRTRTSAAHRRRQERLTHLKVFKASYRDGQGREVPCPYNKYGEEILVIQPIALRRNSDRLFSDAEGKGAMTTDAGRLGLTMGTSRESVRRRRIQDLEQIVTGAAGTSYLINTIAASMVRKLGLHTLPIVNLDGFTGSDTIPAYASNETLFIANSNSGGTADTIKLVHQLAGLPGVLSRLEGELGRREGDKGAGEGSLRARVRQLAADVADGAAETSDPELDALVQAKMPWVYVITNVAASPLGNIGAGLDPLIASAAGVGVTNLPEEECVGSTFAAVASLQWQLALHTFIGELRGDISSQYARRIYAELSRVSDVARQLAGDQKLAAEIQAMAGELVGGNYDFVYTDYVEGVPEEQAHKAAEMIQEMFAGWQFFLFQHGKYAHMKRRSRHALGSVLGHNAPPPSWFFFNSRALKSPFEIGPRVASSFVIAHESDRQTLLELGDYAPDFVFDYPVDSVVLYPFQTLVIGHLISYYWGLARKEISLAVAELNRPFVDRLLELPAGARSLEHAARAAVEEDAGEALQRFSSLSESRQWFDNMGTRRKSAIVSMLRLLAGQRAPQTAGSTITTGGLLDGRRRSLEFEVRTSPAETIGEEEYLDVLKELAVELSSRQQAKLLADHFLVDEEGRPLTREVTVERTRGRTRKVAEYDYLIEYEGLATYYDVESVHPPKIAKAKKGWL